MFAEKLKYIQGYVKVRLTGYAPERFLNLCSNRNILIWNLEYNENHYEFCISVVGFKQLKPILRKTKTRLIILKRYGVPFFFHKYRKRKIFFLGIAVCSGILYAMSLFIWSIEVNGNSHRTDSAIIKFLEENQIYHGILKSKLECSEMEELLRSQYDDVIWASVKIQGTRLIIDIQENLIANNEEQAISEDTPSDLIADKDAVIYSIITRKGAPFVEKGSSVSAGDMLVEGKIPVYNDSGEIVNYQYCMSDADILGITDYEYEDIFSLEYEDKVFTGNQKKSYRLRLFGKQIYLSVGNIDYLAYDIITTEYPLKLGANFYLPLVLCKEEAKEYHLEKKVYTKTDAKNLSKKKLDEFCKKLTKKGVQIIENNVIIVTDGKNCRASGNIKVIESIGNRQTTTITEITQEGQITDESEGNDN